VLRGPVAAPQRTINSESLASWLALRSVEQQSRRIEAIEAARRAALTQPLVEVAPPSLAPQAQSARDDYDANSTAASAPTEVAPRQAEPTTVAVEQAPPPLPPPIIIAPEPVPADRARATPKRGGAARP
jgi:large subunit ribosomal protein L24